MGTIEEIMQQLSDSMQKDIDKDLNKFLKEAVYAFACGSRMILELGSINTKQAKALNALIEVKKCADGGEALISNQGQSLDGYSELANYRQIIEKYEKGK